MTGNKVIEEALAAYSHGAVDTTRELLDAGLEAAAAQRQMDDVLAICCFRGTLAAMAGQENITELLRPCNEEAVWHAVLTTYLEGLSALSCLNAKKALLKFESLKKLRIIDGCETGNFLANLGLAAVYFQRKKYKESFAEYRQVLESLGSRATPGVARVGIGLCALYLNETTYAQKMLEREVSLHPDNDLALIALLVVYVQLRRMDAVAETVATLRERLPENTSILLRASDLLYFRAIETRDIQGSVSAILAILNRVRATGSPDEVALADYQEGRLMIVLGDLAKAKRLMEANIHTTSLLPARIHYAHLLILLNEEEKGLRLLLEINQNSPNQREVLQLLACHASERGHHEEALRLCRLLVESVAPGDVCSWAVAAWCSRLDSERCLSLHRQLTGIYQKLNQQPSLEVLVNEAVLAKDVDALQALVDRTLGASYLPSLQEEATSSLKPVELRYVPCLYNLALLKETDDRAFARHVYTFLVKTHCTFQDPYFRLYVMAKEDGLHRQSIMWLTLLSRVLGDEHKRGLLARSFIGVSFFEYHKSRSVAIKLLKPAHISSRSKTGDPTAALCAAVFYLSSAQRHGSEAPKFLAMAKSQFERILALDPGNLLAAHGLGCCLGLEDAYDPAQALLLRVAEAIPNRPYVHSGCKGHIANAKTRLENYKQGIDYLSGLKSRTPSQDSCLGLCLASEGRYNEAIEVLEASLSACRDEKPMMLYNTALVRCAAFLHGVAKSGDISKEDGMTLRDTLQGALPLMVEFFTRENDSSDMAMAKGYLKNVGKYCRIVMKEKLLPLIAAGIESVHQREEDASRWANAFASYSENVEKEEFQRQKRQRDDEMERQELQKKIIERFAVSGYTMSHAGMDADLIEYHLEHPNGDENEEVYDGGNAVEEDDGEYAEV